MAGPRIYTEAWERLKVAAKELEEREAQASQLEEPPQLHAATRKPRARNKPRILVVTTVVMAFLTVLMGSLWIDSQNRFMTHGREVADLKARIDLLQEKVQKAEEERKRLEDENGTLSMQYEQKAAELVDLERDLEALKAQKDKSVAKPKRPLEKMEEPPARTPVTPKVHQDQPPVSPQPERVHAGRPESRDQQGIKVYTID